MSKGGRENGCPSSSREQIHPSSAFLFYQVDWTMPPTLVKAIFFTPSTYSNKTLLHTYPEIMFYQLSRHSLAQSS